MMRAFPLFLLLASCGNPMMAPMAERPVDVMKVGVEVHVPCKAKEMLGPEPVFDDADEALRDVPFPMPMSDTETLANLFYHVKLLVSGRLQRIKRDEEKTAVLKDC